MLERLLNELSAAGLAGMKVAPDGAFAVTFDDKITVNISHDPEIDMLTFFSRLGTVGPDRASIIYPLLLEANVLWAGTGGATLGVMPQDRCVVLAYQERGDTMSSARFETLLRGLVDVAEFWMEQIQTYVPNPTGEAAAGEPPQDWLRI